MLRRPSVSLVFPREEGCSSTAIGLMTTVTAAVWNNHANRGSAAVTVVISPAVP
jgi:hypothetical protein